MIHAEPESGTRSAPARAPARGEVPGIAGEQIRAFIERIENLHQERKSLADDISEIYGEAKGCGYDVKVLREIVKQRAQDPDKRVEMETLLDLYLRAMGEAA